MRCWVSDAAGRAAGLRGEEVYQAAVSAAARTAGIPNHIPGVSPAIARVAPSAEHACWDRTVEDPVFRIRKCEEVRTWDEVIETCTT